MEADDAPFPPPKIYLSSSLPGSSLPIRAPLTIDSDSDPCLSNNQHFYSRTSSFNSTSSIDISSYGDEHTSVHEEDYDTFLAYPDEEIPIQTCRVKEYSYTPPFVKYPDGNYVRKSSKFDESPFFRPLVETLSGESSSSVADFGIQLGAPVAHLTSDCDSDLDSVEDRRWLDSGKIPADGIVEKATMSPKLQIFSEDEVSKGLQFEDMFSIPADEIVDKITMSPKVRIFSEDEVDKDLQFEGMFSDDSINSVHELSSAMKDSVLAESVEDDECIVVCLNVVVSQRIGAEVLSNSENEIEIEITSDYRNEPKKAVSEKEEETLVVDSQRIDAEVLSNSENQIEIEITSDYRNKSKKAESEKEEETLVDIQPIKSKLLNLIRVLGLSNQDPTVVQLLHKLALENDEFDFSLTILAIGKNGVGKTATINSIFGETKTMTDPFGPGTASVQEIVGNVDGVHLRIIDTPGLRCSPYERSYNLRILSNIKRFIHEHSPDVVLYVDRLDMYTRDYNDSHLLRLITSSLGSSVWRNCIIALTHAGSNDHESVGDSVLPICQFIQQQIVRFGGSDGGMPNLVWLVENHPGYKHDMSCRNRLISNDDEWDHAMPFQPLSESFVECKKAYFNGDGYRVKFLTMKHWSLACRLYS